MKKLLPFLSLVLLAACGEKGSSESSNSSSLDFTVEIDTVQVDPGEEHFIYLSRFLRTSSLSSDKKTLYNFNPAIPELEDIDLDELRLKEVIKLENEGPSGTNSANTYIPMVDVSDKGELFLSTISYLTKLNAARDQMSRFWFTPDSLQGDALSDLEIIYPEGIMSADKDLYFGAYGAQNNSTKSGLAMINLYSMELKKIPLDIYERLEKYEIVFSPNGNGKMSATETVYFDSIEDKVYISTSAFNEIYLVNISDGTVEKKSFHSDLTEDAKQGNFQKSAGSQKELMDLAMEKMKEVHFLKFHYDDQNEKFWRFSTTLDRMIGDSAAYEVILTIFDKDLNQLHEEKVDYSERGSLTFFKDGALYSYINLEDELGFIRIKPTYE
ncbi:DUF4221 family protein [Algoriphagus yeomjeoni]|uniref:Uncharacterized protein DUF4221 n=1 Tax=Algoriphagus yeomjeoni TaxID=291403 RepID=A0A327PS72_9BACT|nr:DUF4221 family protein [Algoriphagus yeomjeoni]RAI95170.1 uncharacterized protein DUF4221 [Algoriphagus yeomjeoni]